MNPPPNEVWVEVKQDDKWTEARAIWGRNGTLPHWETKDGTCYEPRAFTKWRSITTEPTP